MCCKEIYLHQKLCVKHAEQQRWSGKDKGGPSKGGFLNDILFA